MKILGFEITRQKAVPGSNWITGGNWTSIVREPFTGAWQRNMEVSKETVLAYGAVFACVTLIAGDIAKLWLRLMQQDKADGIWSEIPLNSKEGAAFRPVLRKPNPFMDRITFFMYWIICKLSHGNAYALKVRDARGVVTRLYLLDPNRVRVLITPDGGVYYQLYKDDFASTSDVAVPASEIMHDVMYPLFHPLVGVGPIYAAAMPAIQGLKIQENSTRLFANNSNPGGTLTAPGVISNEAAERIKLNWERNYSGPDNIGKIVVLGDGLHYEPMVMKATDAQLIEQLKWSDEAVCRAFHVPPYMVGVGVMPTYSNIEALNQQYYAQCLQVLIEKLELVLDEGLDLVSGPVPYGVEFDLDALLRMDTLTASDAAAKQVGAGILAPNEARRKFELKAVKGGETPILQQQMWPIAKLAEREIPEVPENPDPSQDPQEDPDEVDSEDDEQIDDESTEKMASTMLREVLM